jgi:uncharacterized protein
MQYNVAQLLKGPTGGTRHYTIHEDVSDLDPDLQPLSNLDGKVTLIRTADGILVTGPLHLSVELTCSRCLEPFAFPLQFILEEEFRPSIDIVTGMHLPLTEGGEPATRIDAHHTLDLREVVRQQVLLALPINPVCRSKCAGLCPVCGKNWNEGTCDHGEPEGDPRLAVLRQLYGAGTE